MARQKICTFKENDSRMFFYHTFLVSFPFSVNDTSQVNLGMSTMQQTISTLPISTFDHHNTIQNVVKDETTAGKRFLPHLKFRLVNFVYKSS